MFCQRYIHVSMAVIEKTVYAAFTLSDRNVCIRNVLIYKLQNKFMYGLIALCFNCTPLDLDFLKSQKEETAAIHLG